MPASLIVRGGPDRSVVAALADRDSAGTLHWGDGQSQPFGWWDRPARHRYARPGSYTVSLVDEAGTVMAAERIFARPGPGPAVVFTADAANPNIIDALWDDQPGDLVSRYDIDWGDSDRAEAVPAPAGHVITRAYPAGDYTVRVYDRDARRWAVYPLTVHDKTYDPGFTLARVNKRTAKATITSLDRPGVGVLIDWGDGAQDTLADAAPGATTQHAYDFDDTYIVQCLYTDGVGAGAADTVTIPWPTRRGPKPASEVIWSPDALHPHGAWLRWAGSGWHYTIHWGDGATDRVTSWDKSVRHVYDAAGTYTAVCVSDLHHDWTAAASITVRDQTTVAAAVSLVEPGSNQVRADLARVPDPVRYRIGWGDGTVTEHDGNDLAPVHQYAWDTPDPSITVMDVPARRQTRLTGPSIGPAPDPPVDGFYLEYVDAASGSRRFRLRGGGIPPGETVTWYPNTMAWYRDLTADESGTVTDEIDIPNGINEYLDYRWLSFGIVGSSVPRQYIPVHPPRAEIGLADLTYQINVDGDPSTLEFSASPAMLGTHRIDYGDGTTATIDVQTLPLRARHTYAAGTEEVTATVTLPDGRTAKRRVTGYTPADPCFNHYYPGSCTVCWFFSGWPEHNCPPGGYRGSEEYSPVLIDNGYHPPHVVHRPENGSAWHVAFGYTMPVGQYNFQYTTTFTSAVDHPIAITKAGPKYLDRPPVELVLLPEVEPGADAAITAWFGDTTEWDGGYSGHFHITNHTGSPVPWKIEFTLPAPARLREVWPATASMTDLGEGRWRIWSTHPMDETTTVGARIEPGNTTEQQPTAITGHATNEQEDQ